MDFNIFEKKNVFVYKNANITFVNKTKKNCSKDVIDLDMYHGIYYNFI